MTLYLLGFCVVSVLLGVRLLDCRSRLNVALERVAYLENRLEFKTELYEKCVHDLERTRKSLRERIGMPHPVKR